MRARYYRPVLARWQTKDPLWPVEPCYQYVASSPNNRIDPSGRRLVGSPNCGSRTRDCCRDLFLMDELQIQVFKNCMQKHGIWIGADLLLDLLRKACREHSLDGVKNICVYCAGDTAPGCETDPCVKPLATAVMVCSQIKDWMPVLPPNSRCDAGSDRCPGACSSGSGCDCAIQFCFDLGSPNFFCSILFHEVVHCFGPYHKRGEKTDDMVKAAGVCFCEAVYGQPCPTI